MPNSAGSDFELVARFLENAGIRGLNCLLFGRSSEIIPNSASL
jgi:hypothetical protein